MSYFSLSISLFLSLSLPFFISFSLSFFSLSLSLILSLSLSFFRSFSFYFIKAYLFFYQSLESWVRPRGLRFWPLKGSPTPYLTQINTKNIYHHKFLRREGRGWVINFMVYLLLSLSHIIALNFLCKYFYLLVVVMRF